MLKKNTNMGLFGDIMKGLGSAVKGDPFGVLGSITSIATSFGGTRRQKKLMDYQDRINDANYERERQDKLADYQMQLNDQRQLIDEERRYTSIGSVMQRARNANVSPLAALGVSSGNTLASVSPVSGTSSQGVSQAPDTSASRGQAVISAISTLQDMKIQREQLKIQKAIADSEIAKTEAETNAINERLPFVSVEAQEVVNNLKREGKYKEALEYLAQQQAITEGAKQAELLSVVALNDAKTITEDYLRESKLHINQWQARALQADISRSFSQIRVDNATIDSLVDSLATNEVSRKKMSQEINNLVVARDKAIAEIKRIESDTSLDKTRKQQMIAGIVRDYAFSATSIVNAISNFMPTKSLNKGQSMAWNELVDIAGVSAVLD